MKKIGLIVGLLAAMIYLLSGCSASKKARAPQLTVTPAPYVLYPDTVDHALLDMTFTVPAKRFKKRSRLIVSPYLVWNDTMRQDYDPWAFDRKIYAQKNQRKEVLENYVDTLKPYSMLLEGGYRSLFVVPVFVSVSRKCIRNTIILMITTSRCWISGKPVWTGRRRAVSSTKWLPIPISR